MAWRRMLFIILNVLIARLRQRIAVADSDICLTAELMRVPLMVPARLARRALPRRCFRLTSPPREGEARQYVPDAIPCLGAAGRGRPVC
jgi:hypothetical protein